MPFGLERFFGMVCSILLSKNAASNFWHCFWFLKAWGSSKNPKKSGEIENTLCEVWWLFQIFWCLCLGWMRVIRQKCFCFEFSVPHINFRCILDHKCITSQQIVSKMHTGICCTLCCVFQCFLDSFGALYIHQWLLYSSNNTHVMIYMLSPNNSKKNVQQRGYCPLWNASAAMVNFASYGCYIWTWKSAVHQNSVPQWPGWPPKQNFKHQL